MVNFVLDLIGGEVLEESGENIREAVLKQFVGGIGGSDNLASDENEVQQHQKLEKLYISTRAAKHFQRDIVRGVEGYIVTGTKQVEIGTKLSEDSRKYGSCRANKAMVVGSALEDARHLAQRYDRVRQEAEAQKRSFTSLRKWLNWVKKQLPPCCCGRTAAEIDPPAANAMVEAERTYHQRVLEILDQLEGEMLSERQGFEAHHVAAADNINPPPPAFNETEDLFASHTYDGSTDGMGYFLGEVIHGYQAESDVELTLAVGDYVVVRKVTNNGWAEGECKGKAGWFPFEYVERRERVLASKVAEVF
ncbi:UNVERIFIED_CONTAM: SH3 domain-containing protein 2 [Sesamum calycinum]|uniref:SH3 domain-containing protein 2 n=1 Tax=Sesamum calycinum TaxID=2727403 RepID=A0AAW2QP04_9LAMI